MRKLLSALTWLFFILFLIILTLGLLSITESGSQLFGKIAEKLSPNLQIEGVKGSLIHDLQIKKLDWKTPNQAIHAKNLHLENSFSDLEQGIFQVKTLTADTLDVVLPKHSDTAPSESFVLALPLDIDVTNLSIKQLNIQKGDFKQKINNVQLSAFTKDGRLEISNFTAQPILDNEPVQITLNGDANLNSPYDANSDLKLSYKHPKHGKASGSFKLNGTIDTYTLTGKAKLNSKEYGNSKLDITATGSDHDLAIQQLKLSVLQGKAEATGKIKWDDQAKFDWKFDLQADNINTKAILPDTPAQLSTKFTTQGSLKGDKVKGSIDLLSLDGQLQGYPLSATGKIDLNGTQAKIKTLHATALAGTIDGKGHISWGDQLAWDLKLKTKNIETAKLLPKYSATLSTQFNAQGTLKDKQVNGVIDLQKLQGTFQDSPLTANGKIHLKGNQATIEKLHLEALKGSAEATGDVTWGKELTWDLKLNTNKIHTKKVLPDFPAVVSSQLSSKGSHKNNKTNATIDLQSLSGKLQGYALNGKGKIQINGKQINVEKVQLSSGRNTLFVDGQASEPFDLQWKLDGKKLSQLYKGLSGKLKGSGKLQGTLAKPQGQATLDGSSLRYQDYRLASIKLDIQQKNTRYRLKAKLNKLKTADQTIKSLIADGEGTLEKHQLSLSLQHPEAHIKLKAQGGWKQKQWKGTIKSLALDKTAAGNWTLSSPVAITAGQQHFSSGKLCLKSHSALACSTNKWNAKSGLQAKGALQNVPLSLLKSQLPSNITGLAGTANADFDINRQSGTIKLRLADNSFTIKPDGGKAQTLQYKNARLDAKQRGQKITSNFSAHIQNRGDLSGNATVQLAKNTSKHSINAQIKLDMPSIRWANKLIPEIQQLKGQLNSQIKVSGLLAQPQITGKANLINGSFSLQETGTEIQHINVSVISQKANQANISGSLQSGKGKLNITGSLSGTKADNWKAQVRLRGNNLDFMDTYEIKGLISPDLAINATPKAVNITGTLSIPETRITLNELPTTAIYESDDVVVLGRNTASKRGGAKRRMKSVPFKIHPNVNIIIGNKVSFSGFGLKANLSGRFRVQEQQQELFAQGSVKVSNGVYKAYGQDLKITQGRLVFNGPVDNPGMDIKAVRNLPDIEAGIHLTGTVQQPKTKLFSNPSLSQTDILSYLLTGRKLSEASGDQSKMLLGAITSLGVSGGEGIARSIGTSLGLDSVNINSDNGLKSSKLELGKRLGPDLYLKYIVGIFDTLQHIAIEYRINKRLTLEAQSGENQGFDLIYKMERD